MKKPKTKRILYSLALFSLSLSFFSTSCFPKRYYPDIYEEPLDALDTAASDALDSEPFVPGDWPNVQWWTSLDDCQLNTLMEKALQSNPDIKTAQARLRLAFHAAGAAGSPLWPAIGLESDITRFRISKTGPISGFSNILGGPNLITTPNAQNLPAPIGPPGFTFTQEEINLNANYQIDLWQKNLNNFKAAVGEVLATQADAAFSTVLISTNVAKAYFSLQVMYAREKVALKRIENRKNYLKLIEKRLKSDLATQLTVKTAQSYVIGGDEALKEVRLGIETFKNQLLALITGTFTEVVDPIEIEVANLPQFEIPLDLPLNLLSHRPDVTAAAWRVEEAAKLIKVAKAAYYPNFNIVALFGYQTLHPNVLFKWRSIYGQAGPAVNLPIFEGGLLYANLGEANENYNIAVEQYNKAIITSVQNVLDNLAGLKYTAGEVDDFKRIYTLSEENLKLTKDRYKHQIDSYINVLDAELDAIDKEDQQLRTTGDYYIKYANLINALGGGYQDCCPKD
jgi:NodT family efflux transporter outer membrane factor (OMF) lipoprotein